MKAAAPVAAERISELLLRFNLSTAALEMSKRLAGHEEALQLVSEVLELEAEARQQRRVARLRRAAQLPADKSLETLDLNVLPAALIRRLRELMRGEFLEQADNILVFGLPG